MLIRQRVDGYYDSAGNYNSYQDLRQKNPSMRSYSRIFRTSGVILFLKNHHTKAGFKTDFATTLREIFVHEHSIAPRDIGAAAASIDIRNLRYSHTGFIAIFDETYGSLRLTERLYRDFMHILDRMISARQNDAEFVQEILKIKSLCATFTGHGYLPVTESSSPTGYERVFAKGSIVSFRERGPIARDVKIVGVYVNDSGELMYRIESPTRLGQPPMRHSVPAERVEPSVDTDDWEWAWWNRATEEYETLPEDDSVDTDASE